MDYAVKNRKWRPKKKTEAKIQKRSKVKRKITTPDRMRLKTGKSDAKVAEQTPKNGKRLS
jgi:hypothetical protein